jgi:hypothetical protein
VVSGLDKPLSDALSILAAWAADADEQAYLQRHVRSVLGDLEGALREDALIELITGLIILNGGLLKLQADRNGVALADLVTTLRQRTGADE